MKLSVVIPVYNEQNSIIELSERLKKVFDNQKIKEYEVWFIDDGSVDKTVEMIKQVQQNNNLIKLIRLRLNMGKTMALREGFARVTGDLVCTMDADLQDQPEEIPNLITKINEGFDLVSGWKQNRYDPWHKVLPSRIFNWLVRKVSGMEIHDMNCGLKIMKKEVVEELTMYGELHRFIPWLAIQRGFLITEIPVLHKPRKHGVSKYGWTRMVAGFFDLMTQMFLIRFGGRPAHYFGLVGMLITMLGVGLGSYLTVIWLTGEKIGGRPMLVLVVLLVVIGIQTLSFGFLSELMLGLKKLKEDAPIAEIIDKGDRR